MDALDFLWEFVMPFFVFVGGLALTVAMIFTSIYLAVAPASCYAKGDKMGVQVSWGFWTDCTVMVQGTWLPWKMVAPVEVDGKIVFKPRPMVILKSAK